MYSSYPFKSGEETSCLTVFSDIFEPNFNTASIIIGHVTNIATMQFFTRISRNTQSKFYMLSATECVWNLHNNALWDTH